MNYRPLSDNDMAARVARDIPEGAYVNLGIGLPSLVAGAIAPGREVIFHSENGVLGVGPAPEPHRLNPDLINASKELITLVPGGVFVHHTDSFMIIRGGHLSLALLGAYQVSRGGDLANWSTGDASSAPAVGGAMDLAVGAQRVFVMMRHVARTGEPKIVERCDYPLTAAGVVDRIYTDLAILDVVGGNLVVRALVAGLSRAELQDLTVAQLTFPESLEQLVADPRQRLCNTSSTQTVGPV